MVCAVLHAFTHLYTTVLPPLYLLITADLHLKGVAGATWLMTAQAFTYCAAGLPLGFLADRSSRKRLLLAGIVLNAGAFIALGLAPSYAWAQVCVVLAGLAGGFYHPPANALVTAHYPGRQGKAIGFVGMGAAIGFFIGPLYGGWRGQMAGWRAPCLELGILGLVAAVAFAVVARDAPARREEAAPSVRAGAGFLGYFVLLSLAFGLRDFAGMGFTTFTALFLPQAHQMSAGATGLYLGLMSLAALPANPLLGSASDGPRRLRWAAGILLAAAAGAAVLPWVPRVLVLPALLGFGFFLLASYPVVEASISEVVPERMRGRAFGVFIASGGVLSSFAHWAMGKVKDDMVGASAGAAAFRPAYAALGGLLVLSVLIGLPLLRWVRRELRRGS